MLDSVKGSIDTFHSCDCAAHREPVLCRGAPSASIGSAVLSSMLTAENQARRVCPMQLGVMPHRNRTRGHFRTSPIFRMERHSYQRRLYGPSTHLRLAAAAPASCPGGRQSARAPLMLKLGVDTAWRCRGSEAHHAQLMLMNTGCTFLRSDGCAGWCHQGTFSTGAQGMVPQVHMIVKRLIAARVGTMVAPASPNSSS